MTDSPYCQDCDSCGDDGCCSPFICLKKCIKKNPMCMYGEHTLAIVEINYDFAEWVIAEVDRCGSLSAKDINTKYGDMIRKWQEGIG